MLKRFFIPLLVVLLAVAVAVYLWFGRSHKARDVRDTVRVERFTLDNGLRVVVLPNDRIPAVTHLLLVRAGAADDPYGKTGLAHYVEHLMFTGTPDHPEGKYERAIQRLGGEQNAYTTRDYTAYYATVARDHLDLVMAMDADRLQHLALSDAHGARELNVIAEERHMRVENRPAAVLDEQLDAITFLNHPYRQPVIGWATDIAGLTVKDARAFMHRYYRPSNLLLVVAGDVSTREVRRLAARYYGGLPGGKAPVRAWPEEPPLRIERHAQMRDENVQEARLIRQYIAPSLGKGGEAESTALSLAAYYFGGSDTSLLYRKLVRDEKIATTVSVAYSPMSIGPALLTVGATPAPGVSPEQLEAALDRVLADALSSEPPATDLARAKSQFKAEVIFAQDGLEALAHLMAQLYMLGLDEQYFYRWTETVDAVTPAAMLAAARNAMQRNGSVTGYLLPKEAENAR